MRLIRPFNRLSWCSTRGNHRSGPDMSAALRCNLSKRINRIPKPVIGYSISHWLAYFQRPTRSRQQNFLFIRHFLLHRLANGRTVKDFRTHTHTPKKKSPHIHVYIPSSVHLHHMHLSRETTVSVLLYGIYRLSLIHI